MPSDCLIQDITNENPRESKVEQIYTPQVSIRMCLSVSSKSLVVKLNEPSHFENILKLRSDRDVQRFTIKRPQTRQDDKRFMEMILLYQQKHGFDMASVFLTDKTFKVAVFSL